VKPSTEKLVGTVASIPPLIAEIRPVIKALWREFIVQRISSKGQDSALEVPC
jgi:hypothetical protein